jgi:hypothetical protein
MVRKIGEKVHAFENFYDWNLLVTDDRDIWHGEVTGVLQLAYNGPTVAALLEAKKALQRAIDEAVIKGC